MVTRSEVTKVKTAYFPLDNTSNFYVNVTGECIRNAGYEVFDFPKTFRELKNLKDIKIANLNWFESGEGLFNCLSRIALIYYLRLKDIKIIYTCHNKQPHDKSNRSLSTIIIKLLCKHSTAIIGLCDETKNILGNYIDDKKLQKKYCTIPHVTYEGCYPEIEYDFREELGIAKEAFVLLSVGAVRRYKNIELIIETAKRCSQDIVYVIAGSCSDKEYLKELNEKIIGLDNVKTIFRFIKDEEMASLIKASNMLILPYSIESSLNSGTAIMAMTYGRSFISPNIGTLKDIKDKSLFLTYEYKKENEHLEHLIKKVEEAYELHCDKPYLVKNMGRRGAEYIAKYHSKNIVSAKFKEIYDSLQTK